MLPIWCQANCNRVINAIFHVKEYVFKNVNDVKLNLLLHIYLKHLKLIIKFINISLLVKCNINFVALYSDLQCLLKIAVCLYLDIFMRGRRCKIRPRGKIYKYEIGVSFTVQFFLPQCYSRWSCSYYYKAQIHDINPKITRSAIHKDAVW